MPDSADPSPPDPSPHPDRSGDNDDIEPQDLSSSEADDEVLDGGDVRGIDELQSFNQQRHEADTARNLAYLLVGILGGYVIIHYLSVILIIAMGWNDGDVSTLQDIFNASLPVLAGLAGSAVTYFFTKRSR